MPAHRCASRRNCVHSEWCPSAVSLTSHFFCNLMIVSMTHQHAPCIIIGIHISWFLLRHVPDYKGLQNCKTAAPKRTSLWICFWIVLQYLVVTVAISFVSASQKQQSPPFFESYRSIAPQSFQTFEPTDAVELTWVCALGVFLITPNVPHNLNDNKKRDKMHSCEWTGICSNHHPYVLLCTCQTHSSILSW